MCLQKCTFGIVTAVHIARFSVPHWLRREERGNSPAASRQTLLAAKSLITCERSGEKDALTDQEHRTCPAHRPASRHQHPEQVKPP